MKILARSRNSIIRIVSIAVAGSTSLWFTKNYDNTIRVSVPARLHESLSHPHWAVNTIPPHSFGLPIFSFRDENDSSVGPNEIPKQCSVCLGRDSFANAATRVGPAVVNISFNKGIYVIGGDKSIGSGTIIDKDGTILTCAHNVVDFHGKKWASKGRVDVTLQDGRTFQGTIVTVDLHSDIAILKINSETPLPEAKLGSSSTLRTGDWVIAMGCPLSLHNTVTAGIVSCVDRKSSDLGIRGVKREYLQTDCAINPGNSGGPLVNINGEVVGVNIMKVVDADGLSFAVPIDSAMKIIERSKEKDVRPWIGLKMIDLSDSVIQQLKSRDGAFPYVKRGILVAMVIPGSPADRAGFRPDDIVVQFNGKSVGTVDEIVEIMSDRVGEPLKAVVQRETNKLVTLTVIAEEFNPSI